MDNIEGKQKGRYLVAAILRAREEAVKLPLLLVRIVLSYIFVIQVEVDGLLAREPVTPHPGRFELPFTCQPTKVSMTESRVGRCLFERYQSLFVQRRSAPFLGALTIDGHSDRGQWG